MALQVNEPGLRRSIAIPEDVAYIVIDDLHYDKNTLFACSLVCRSWRQRSQQRIFARITIDNTSLHGYKQFWESKPHISTFVRSLDLMMLHMGVIQDFAVVLDLLSLLPRLEDFRLNSLISAPYLSGHTCFPDRCAQNRRLQKLSIVIDQGGFLGHLSILCAILHTFIQVDTIFLDFGPFAGFGEDIDLILEDAFKYLPVLSQIKVQSIISRPQGMSWKDVQGSFTFFQTYLALGSLRHLAVEAKNSDGVAALRDFLGHNGNVLESLCLDLTTPVGEGLVSTSK